MTRVPLGVPSPFRTRRPDRAVQRRVVAAGTVLAALLAAWFLAHPPLLARLEALGHDALLLALPPAPATSGVAVVDIDEASLQSLGQWPWPRHRVARMLDAIHSAGARALAVDLLFAEPDRLSPAALQASLRSDLKVELDLAQIPQAHRDNDRALAQSVTSSGAILGVWFAFGGGPPLPALPWHEVLLVREPGAPAELPLPRASGGLPPIPPLASAARAVGSLNALPDEDGRLRRAPLLILAGDRLCPSLVLAAAATARKDGPFLARASQAGVEEVWAGGLHIPTDRQGNLVLPFRPGTLHRFPRISASDLLAGRGAGELAGKVVLLGATATAEGDSHPTPFDRQLPGVLVHAVALDTLLRGDFLHLPAWALGLNLVLAAVALALMVWLLARESLWVCAAACLGGLLALWFGAQVLLLRTGLFLPPVLPMLALAAGFVVPGAVRFRGEERAAIRNARELAVAQDCAIIGLVSVAATRDPETGQHLLRTRHYVRILAEHLAKHPRFREELTPGNIEAIVKSAPLHDLGKVGVPDAILRKPEGLTEGETDAMRQHPLIGQRALARAERLSGVDVKHSFLHYAQEIACSHHEHWDGSGYPYGLRGEAIPLAGRIMALADAYDAIRSRRTYKEPLSHEAAAAHLAQASGRIFDPEVVKAFLEVQDRFRAVAEQHQDDADDFA